MITQTKNINPDINPKAILYCRVSSKEQEETGYSLPSQEKLLTEYALRKGLAIEKVFSVAESASGSRQRKVFSEMMTFMKNRKVNHLLCEKVDRLTRNFKEAIVANDWAETDENHRIHFVKQNLVIHKYAKSDEKFRWDIEIVLAKKYISNLSEEVKKGQKEKISQGWLPTQPPPGYKTTGEKGHKTIVVDDTVAPLIKKMFESYASGNYSLGRLYSEMTDAGLCSRSGKLSMSRLHQLLKDPFYYGKFLWKGDLYQGKHEPLIHKDLFLKVQDRLGRRGENPTFSKSFGLFKAKIHCEKCDGLVTWYMKKGHWYGHCNNNQKSKNCIGKTCLREDRVENSLLPIFDTLAPKSNEILDWIKEILLDAHGETTTIREIEVNNINAQLGLIRSRKDKLYEDKLDGAITLDFYNHKFSSYTQQEEELENKLLKLNDNNDEQIKLGVTLHELAFHLRRIYEATENRTDDDNEIKDLKRLAYSQIFANLVQDHEQVNPVFTPAGEYLLNWMPKLNNYYEQTKNPTKSEASSVFQFQLSEPRPLEAHNKLRTSRNTDSMPRIALSTSDSRHLLRGQDSNLEPSPYT